MKRIILLCLLICMYFISYSQKTPSLHGQITDVKTGASLEGASIVLIDFKTGTLSDKNGNYIFSNLPKGHTTIEISFQGYKTIIDHIDIESNTMIHFKLSPSVIENEGITVTAVGSAMSIRKTPVPVVKMNKEQLLSTPSSNIIDALRNQPGISQLSTGPAISKPIIRGLGYNRLVVINDGVRQEGQQWGDEHGIEIDENSVNRIEIVKGPASLIYGSDALAGVVNIITATPIPANTIKGNIISSYATNNQQRSLYAGLGGNTGRFNWNAWGNHKRAGDYKNKYDGYVWNSKFNENNFGGNAGFTLNNGFVNIIFSRFDQKTGLIEGERDSLGRFIKLLPNGEQTYPSTTDFKNTDPSVPYQHITHTRIISENSVKAWNGRITFTMGFQRNERKEFGDPDNQGEAELYFDLQTFNYSAAYHFKEKRGWHSNIGINGMRQQNFNKGLEVLIPEYKLFDMGGYFFTQKTIGKSTFSGGIRFDYRQLQSSDFNDGMTQKFNAFEKKYNNFSGSAGISYAATRNVILKLNVARGFRAPSIPELASNGAHEGTNRYEYGTTGLKSETTWQLDAGAELSTEHLLLKGNLFYNHISNFIFYSKLSGVNSTDSLVESDGNLIPAFKFAQQTANLAGFEFVSDFHPHPLDWLHWQNTISYVRGRFNKAIEGNRNVPFIPATHWISELRTSFFQKSKLLKEFTVHFEMDHTFNQDKTFNVYDTETSTPGYTLLNAGITTGILRKGKKILSIYLLANNLNDAAYQSHLSRLKYTSVNVVSGRQGVYNTGRNFIFRINIPLSFENGKSKIDAP